MKEIVLETGPDGVARPAPSDRVPQPAVDDPLGALIAWLMDSAFVIPGTRIRFGLDALIGLFPGVGDSVGALISSVLIAHGARAGVPKVVLLRMAGNVLINSLVGAVPLLGDLFSVYFRSNVRNYELLRQHAGRSRGGSASDWAFVLALITGLVVFLGGIVLGIVALFRSLS